MPRTPKTHNSASAHERRHQRMVRRNSTETVKHLMFLFGVEFVPQEKFDQAVFVIAGKWQEGFEDGMALEKTKPSLLRDIRKILRMPVPAPNAALSGVERKP